MPHPAGTPDSGRYHTRFGNHHSRTVALVDDTLPELWSLDDAAALARLQALADDLSDVYEIPAPTVTYSSQSHYAPYEARLAVNKPSIVSFLHEYRHHMQHYGWQVNDNIEEDARGWSISLFATAEPRHFDRAWRRGTIMFLPPYPSDRAGAGVGASGD